jgi:hypothetical protein
VSYSQRLVILSDAGVFAPISLYFAPMFSLSVPQSVCDSGQFCVMILRYARYDAAETVPMKAFSVWVEAHL